MADANEEEDFFSPSPLPLPFLSPLYDLTWHVPPTLLYLPSTQSNYSTTTTKKWRARFRSFGEIEGRKKVHKDR